MRLKRGGEEDVDRCRILEGPDEGPEGVHAERGEDLRAEPPPAVVAGRRGGGQSGSRLAASSRRDYCSNGVGQPTCMQSASRLACNQPVDSHAISQPPCMQPVCRFACNQPAALHAISPPRACQEEARSARRVLPSWPPTAGYGQNRHRIPPSGVAPSRTRAKSRRRRRAASSTRGP